MTFSEEVDKIIDILEVDKKSVDLYKKIEIERFIEDIKLSEYKEGYLDARSKYATEYETEEVDLW